MKKIKKLFKKIKGIKFNSVIQNNKFPYVVIFIFSIIGIFPMLQGNIHMGDDILFHLGSIQVMADGLPFSIFAKIVPDLGNNLGFGIGIFYPALPHIVGGVIYAILNIFNQGLVATLIILYFLIYFFSGLTMYILGKKVFKSNLKGLIASLIYITYNYFFVDLIMRTALNESFMFIFMPAILLGLYYLFNEKNIKMFYICFVGGYVCLMYSHLVMSVYFTVFLIIFLLFYIKDVFKRENFKHLCLAALLILVLTSTFTIPMIECKMDTDYQAFIERNWTSYDDIWSTPLSGWLTPYYYATGDYDGLIYTNLNFIIIFFLVLAIIGLFKKHGDKVERKFIIATSVFIILGILLNAIKIIWFYMPALLLNIQFVWRLALFVGLGIALVGAYGSGVYFNWFKKSYLYVALLIIMLFLGYFAISNNNKLTYQDVNEYMVDLDDWASTREHFPVSMRENNDYYEERDDEEIVILDGEGEIELLENDVPYMKFEVTDIDDEVTLELPRIYYIGYTITDENGNKIEYEEDEYGFISIEIDKEGTYTVKYTGTVLYRIAFVIKGITIILIIATTIYYHRKKRLNN